jgi:hypothetical protein
MFRRSGSEDHPQHEHRHARHSCNGCQQQVSLQRRDHGAECRRADENQKVSCVDRQVDKCISQTRGTNQPTSESAWTPIEGLAFSYRAAIQKPQAPANINGCAVTRRGLLLMTLTCEMINARIDVDCVNWMNKGRLRQRPPGCRSLR